MQNNRDEISPVQKVNVDEAIELQVADAIFHLFLQSNFMFENIVILKSRVEHNSTHDRADALEDKT